MLARLFCGLEYSVDSIKRTVLLNVLLPNFFLTLCNIPYIGKFKGRYILQFQNSFLLGSQNPSLLGF